MLNFSLVNDGYEVTLILCKTLDEASFSKNKVKIATLWITIYK